MTTTKASVEITQDKDGLWLTVNNRGRAATTLLEPKGPLGTLYEWAEEQMGLPDPIQVLRDLFEAGNLVDHHYHIRESEGEGWDGPRITKWGEACAAARKLIAV